MSREEIMSDLEEGSFPMVSLCMRRQFESLDQYEQAKHESAISRGVPVTLVSVSASETAPSREWTLWSVTHEWPDGSRQHVNLVSVKEDPQ